MGGKDVIKAFLGEDTEFNGTLTFGGTVRIDGAFEGKIETADNLIIGEKSKVKADITVGTLLVQGTLNGDVVASKRIHITSTGKVYGNIATAALNVEDGAVMQGGIKMLSAADQPVKPKNAQGAGSPPSGQTPAKA